MPTVDTPSSRYKAKANAVSFYAKWALLLSSLVSCSALGFFAPRASAQVSQTSQLVVEVNGLRNQSGQICLGLFNSNQGFPGDVSRAAQRRCVTITASPVRVAFSNLRAGSYAVSVLHDANFDNQANRNAFGIPTEGFGFSRNPAIQARVPRFNDAAILVAGPNTTVQIQLNYF